MADHFLLRLLGRTLLSIPRPSRAGAAASLAAAGVLAGSAHAALIEPASIAGFAFDLTKLLTLSVTVGCVAAAALSFTLLLSRRGDTALQEAKARLAAERTRLERAETLLSADDQKTIVWDHSDANPEVIGSLPERAGAPYERAAFLAIGRWLDPASVAPVEEAVGRLRRFGEPFQLSVRSQSDALLEVTGRTSGKRLIVRFRELTGERRSLAELKEQATYVAGELEALRALADALPLPLWRRNRHGRLVWVNPAFARAVEASGPDAVVKAGAELLATRSRDEIRDAHRAKRDFQGSGEAVIGGERRRLQVYDVLATEGSVGVAVDVSEVDAVRDEMRRAAEAHARTLDELAAAVAVFDKDRRLLFHNAAFRALWGCSPHALANAPEEDALLDQFRADRKLPEQSNYREWRARHLAAYGTSERREEMWHLPDGRSLRMVATPNASGGLTYVYENVTDMLSLESRVNTLSRLQGETLDHLAEGVAVFGSDGKLRLFNPALVDIWRLSPAMLREAPHIADIIRDCSAIYADEATWKAIRIAVTDLDHASPAAGRMERSDGSVIEFATVTLPEGMTMATFVDVTDSVRVRRALEERAEALEAADRLKSDFIGNVSYELRSPLTTIIGFSGMLAEGTAGPLNPIQREYMDHIASSSSSLLALINDILDLATVDAGTMTLSPGEVDVRAVVDGAVEGLRDRLAEKRIAFVTEFPERIGSFRADEARVRQILFNLLSNAVQFSEPGGRIEVKAERAGGAIVFRVRDHGVGIPEDVLPTVFQRFEGRANAGHARGAGLGLSIVKSLVDLHGGTVEVRSRQGEGTEVTVRLPETPSPSPGGGDKR